MANAHSEAADPKALQARTLALVLGAVALCVIALLLFGDEPARPQFAQGQDKLEHVAAFAGLGFLFALGGRVRDFTAAGALLVMAALAAEALQPVLTVTREGSFGDGAAGALGVIMGLMGAACANAALLRPAAASSPRQEG